MSHCYFYFLPCYVLLYDFVCFCMLLYAFVCFCMLLPSNCLRYLTVISTFYLVVCFCMLLYAFVCYFYLIVCFCMILYAFVWFYQVIVSAVFLPCCVLFRRDITLTSSAYSQVAKHSLRSTFPFLKLKLFVSSLV